MKKLLACLEQTLLQGENIVLVTIIASSGSTPQGTGARMLVTKGGRLAGTIGGGAVEHRCIIMAQELVGSSAASQQTFSLNSNDTANLGMVCGGQVNVHFMPIHWNDTQVLALCRDAAVRFEQDIPFWLLTPLHEQGALTIWPQAESDHAAILPGDVKQRLSPKAELRTINGHSWFAEQIQQSGIVYLFGGGHVTQALVPVLAPLNFPCVVLEDRQEFANPSLFPTAREVRLIDFSKLAEQLSVTKHDYVCIMTRGHQNDLLVQQQILHTPACYIGLIGSVRKAAVASASLRKMGFSEADLARIVTPIGLPIGGRSPAEIAISIAAQLIQYRAGLRQTINASGERT